MLPNILVNFLLCASFLWFFLTLYWGLSYILKDASIIDIFWGAGFGCVALICWNISTGKTPHLTLMAVIVTAWALRLTLYLAWRNIPHGEDSRYIAMRKRAEKKGLSENAWRIRALFSIYYGQGFLILLISAPIWVAMATTSGAYPETHPTNPYGPYATPIGLISIIGTALWLIGFLFEAIGDWQLARFKAKHKDYDGLAIDKPVLDTGLWKYTRHPNYFGNACMWWGIWLVACQAPWGWVTVFAPVIMTILLTRVSGRDLLEREMKKRPAYQDYIERTSDFFPRPPKRHPL